MTKALCNSMHLIMYAFYLFIVVAFMARILLWLLNSLSSRRPNIFLQVTFTRLVAGNKLQYRIPLYHSFANSTGYNGAFCWAELRDKRQEKPLPYVSAPHRPFCTEVGLLMHSAPAMVNIGSEPSTHSGPASISTTYATCRTLTGSTSSVYPLLYCEGKRNYSAADRADVIVKNMEYGGTIHLNPCLPRPPKIRTTSKFLGGGSPESGKLRVNPDSIAPRIRLHDYVLS